MISNEVLAKQLSELKEIVEFTAEHRRRNEDRTQDTEEVVASVIVDITKLTPSDDLEAVKRTVNQIIDELSRN